MKKLWLISILLLMMSYQAFSGNVFIVKHKSDADVVVYVTNNRYDNNLNLLVYVTRDKNEAKNCDEVWYRVNYSSEANIKIYFTKNKSEADIIVSYVSHKYEAGWRRANKFLMRLY